MKQAKNMNVLRSILISALLIVAGAEMTAQNSSPVSFQVTQEKVSDDMVQVIFKADIAPGWHVYSVEMPEDGPVSASVTVDSAEGAEPEGGLVAEGNEISTFDGMFGMDVRYFENSVTFIQKFRVNSPSCHVKGYLEYAACNDSMCIPPSTVEFTVEL